MKVVGIQIEGNEIIAVVLEKSADGIIIQTDESNRFDVTDHTNSSQIQQFRDQLNSYLDSVNPSRIGIRMRNAKVKSSSKVRPPSPISFKLEGIIQLYEKIEIEFIWPQTITAFKKKNESSLLSNHKYQQEAFDIAYFLINKRN